VSCESGAIAAAPQADASFEPYSPQFFTPDEFRTVEILTEMIIPTDETPGAKEARVAEYIDSLVFSAAEFEPSMQQEWIDGLKALDREGRQKYSRPFLRLSASEHENLLTEMSLPERDPEAKHPGFAFYRTLKATTADAFYSSRVGLFDVLGYKGLAFLTKFPGCTSPPNKT
jgi:gluconate 2-dehydrogenase gamma chain